MSSARDIWHPQLPLKTKSDMHIAEKSVVLVAQAPKTKTRALRRIGSSHTVTSRVVRDIFLGYDPSVYIFMCVHSCCAGSSLEGYL